MGKKANLPSLKLLLHRCLNTISNRPFVKVKEWRNAWGSLGWRGWVCQGLWHCLTLRIKALPQFHGRGECQVTEARWSLPWEGQWKESARRKTELLNRTQTCSQLERLQIECLISKVMTFLPQEKLSGAPGTSADEVYSANLNLVQVLNTIS